MAAELTREQKSAIDSLRHEFGKEDSIMCEERHPDDWPHGMAWVRWRGDQMPNLQEKVIYINPSGYQVSWERIDYEWKGEEGG